MTDEEKKHYFRRKNPFFDLFSEFDRMDEMMNELMGKSFQDFDKMKLGTKPGVYGFSVKIDQTGRPVVQEFGNMHPAHNKIQMKDEREPLVDVIEHDKTIDILAELPGVDKKDIDLRVKANSLEIHVPQKFLKKVKLPVVVKEDSVKAHYKNGVLTVELQKKKAGKSSKRIEIA